MSELLASGVDLMILGMLTVFVFLSVLVVGTKLMSFIILRFETTKQDITTQPMMVSSNNDQELAAVAAAVTAVFNSKKM